MNTDLRALAILAAFAVLSSGCDKGTTDIGEFDDAGCPSPAAEDSGGDGGTDAIPLVVDCSFHWDGVTQGVRIEPAGLEDEGTDPLEFGPLLVSPYLFDDEFEGRSFQITIYKEDGTLTASTLYQMDRTKRPANEFWGDHGFTGLNSVRDSTMNDSLQYACFASDPADPIHVWEN